MWDKVLSILGGNLFTGIGDLISKFVPDPTKQAEIKLELAKLQTQTELRLEEVAASDRNSARQREMVVKDATPKVLAYGITTGFFGTLIYVMMYGVPPDSGAHDVMLVLMGSLGTAWTGIVAYYFGSSAGSAAKTDLLSRRGTSGVSGG